MKCYLDNCDVVMILYSEMNDFFNVLNFELTNVVRLLIEQWSPCSSLSSFIFYLYTKLLNITVIKVTFLILSMTRVIWALIYTEGFIFTMFYRLGIMSKYLEKIQACPFFNTANYYFWSTFGHNVAQFMLRHTNSHFRKSNPRYFSVPA